jgi:hypothetical protein
MEGVLHSLSICELSLIVYSIPQPTSFLLYANLTPLCTSCSTMALVAFSIENSGDTMTVSQSLNIVYHSPAQL